ncbi:hypothetical protein BaRGS_00022329 [Batillaria attramentaria]|uniref:Uncharacterized protein n=1 Tax=Batillaria attramentaria TaxID=370345 RepID=A0ABD0KGU2_9CAEN
MRRFVLLIAVLYCVTTVAAGGRWCPPLPTFFCSGKHRDNKQFNKRSVGDRDTALHGMCVSLIQNTGDISPSSSVTQDMVVQTFDSCDWDDRVEHGVLAPGNPELCIEVTDVSDFCNEMIQSIAILLDDQPL